MFHYSVTKKSVTNCLRKLERTASSSSLHSRKENKSYIKITPVIQRSRNPVWKRKEEVASWIPLLLLKHKNKHSVKRTLYQSRRKTETRGSFLVIQSRVVLEAKKTQNSGAQFNSLGDPTGPFIYMYHFFRAYLHFFLLISYFLWFIEDGSSDDASTSVRSSVEAPCTSGRVRK